MQKVPGDDCRLAGREYLDISCRHADWNSSIGRVNYLCLTRLGHKRCQIEKSAKEYDGTRLPAFHLESYCAKAVGCQAALVRYSSFFTHLPDQMHLYL